MTFDNLDVNEVSDAGVGVEQVLRDLDAPHGMLPVAAIRAAQQLGPQIVPGLINLIGEATRGAREEREPEKNGHFFALFLLVEFRAKEAWPGILEAVTLPGEWPSILFGDAKHEALSQAVMTMAHDRIEEVVAVIRTREVDENVRWAMISGLALCVADGSHSREEIVTLLRDLLNECLAQKRAEIALALVLTLLDLYPREAYEEIKKAFDEQLVYEGEVSLEEVQQQIELGEEATIKEFVRGNRPITDTVETLRHWASFRSRNEPQPASPVTRPSVLAVSPPPASEPVQQVRHSQPRIGRNDPCSCGSGKKYKKCCARSAR